MLYGSAFMHRGVPYFPNLVVPIVIGGIGIGMVVVPLTLAAIAGVGFDQIGPVSAMTLMLQSLGGPLVLAVIQAVITSRTLYLGGTTGPVKFMNDTAAACARPRLHLRAAVGGRSGRPRRRCGAVHRLHAGAGCPRAGSQGSDRRRGDLAPSRLCGATSNRGLYGDPLRRLAALAIGGFGDPLRPAAPRLRSAALAWRPAAPGCAALAIAI